MVAEYFAIALFCVICLVLLTGYPVAFVLAGVSLWFACITSFLGYFDWALLNALPSRLYGLMTNQTLLAVPLFVLMGVTMEKSRIAENLLLQITKLFQSTPAGLGLAVIIVGVLLAASTGIVGATVITMGLLALPSFLQQDYPKPLACGLICATGTLGQIIPPSIALVLLGDVLSNAYQQAQIRQGLFSPETVSVGDLFVGAIIPGLILVAGYVIYLFWASRKHQLLKSITPDKVKEKRCWKEITHALMIPLSLIFIVLGSIIAGWATPTEAAGVGACGAMALALVKKVLNLKLLKDICVETSTITSMVFMILVGASIFSLVFKGLGGDLLIERWFDYLPGGQMGAVICVMLLVFLLGFILDFIEITYVVIPIVGPILLLKGADPVWLGIILAVNLQTSFLTPPFGFSLFYLRGVAPKSIATEEIYRGVIPFIVIQLIVLTLLICFPTVVTWLPDRLG